MNFDYLHQHGSVGNPPARLLQAAYSSHLTSPYSQQDRSELASNDGQTSARELPHHNISQSSHRSSLHSSTLGGSQLDEQRKQEILQRLQQERDVRRAMMQESNQEGSVQTAGFGNHLMPSRSARIYEEVSLSSQGGSSATGGRDHLVQRLLNERKVSRGHNASSYSQLADYQAEEEFKRGSMDHFGNQSTGLGGFNPEALYQEEALQEYSQQDRRSSSRDRQGSNEQREYRSDHKQSFRPAEEIEDKRYREAVEYARAQIERDRKKRLADLAAAQKEELRREPTNRSSESRSNSHHRHQSSIEYLPPSIKQVERHLANNSNEKHQREMNNDRALRTGKHCFTYESEEEFQTKKCGGAHSSSRNKLPRDGEERGFYRTAKTVSSAGDYMKPTVNAEMKKQTGPTVARTKQAITEAEKKFNEDHTFKPAIKEYPLPPSKEMSKEERWKKLTEPKTSELQKRERIKAQIEIEQTQRDCPFRPQIKAPTSAKSGRSFTSKSCYDTLPLPDRLLHEADLRKEKREKLKRELEMEQMKDCSFKPKILGATVSSASQSTIAVNIEKLQGRDPIHQRVSDLQKEKNEKLQKLRMKSEQEQLDSFTFQPQVNRKSAKMAVIKNEAPVVERLYKDANDRIEKQMSHNVSVNEQLNREYSFHPQISKSSAYLSAQSDMFSGNMKEFHERQEAFLKKQQENRLEARKKWADEERFAFRPEINATSEVIVESDPSRGAETSQERINRLYCRDQKRQEVVREIIEKEVYSQYTFKPEINKVSKAIARNSTTIEELAYNPKGRERKELLQEQLMTQEFSDCTFRPQTTKTKKYQNVTSTYSMTDCSTTEEYSRKLKEKLKEKQERIAQERREREYQQMKDCSFHPKILDKDPSSITTSESVSVKGLSRHLELKELKKKQDEDRRLREAEVFGLEHKFAVRIEDPSKIKKQPAPPLHQTIPEPFELTKQDEKRRAQLLKDIKDKEMTECTFKPRTNHEGRNKKLINDLVQQIDAGQRHQHQYEQRQPSNDNKENLGRRHLYYNMPQQMHTESSGCY